MLEFQLESLFKHHVYYAAGSRLLAYTAICGCGPNAATLHYGHAGAPNDRLIGPRDAVLLDLGAECSGSGCYGADTTCSFPAADTFSDDQRFLFDTVREPFATPVPGASNL
jgi:Xaa-Pro dipeptidase